MPELLGPTGQPISTFKKAKAPKLGPAFGDWAGRDVVFNQLPGGAILQFNLDALTLADYRAMRYHPQINASLSMLTFMLHQIDWWVECENQKIQDMVESNLRQMWTRLIRALSQSLWAGYSPIVMEYENNAQTGYIQIAKFKDLIPDECTVNWKEVEGYSPLGGIKPKYKVYDGIKQQGYPTIPADNTLWYPLMMENGDYYGRQLLKPAFAAWYFSTLVHLFANRYYERFGEPTPIGRAPFEAEIEVSDGVFTTGKEAMETILSTLRSRGVVTLPSDRMQVGNSSEYEYDIEYLESQMRGADFERYLARLDEEMSLALFTPILLFRTGNVGSNALGVQHTQTWLWTLNALAGDMKEYIDRYICERLKAFNFSANAPECTWHYRRQGKQNTETLKSIITEMVRAGTARVDVNELGLALGLTIEEVEVLNDPGTNPGDIGGQVGPDNATQGQEGGGATDIRTGRDRPKRNGPRTVGEPRAAARQISNRIQSQVEKAWRESRFGTPEFAPSLGYRRKFVEALEAEGVEPAEAQEIAQTFYERTEAWMADALAIGMEEYEGPNDFMSLFNRRLDIEIDALTE